MEHTKSKRHTHDEHAHDFVVETKNVYYRTDDGFREVNARANVRTDTGESLGIVSGRYHIIQNADMHDVVERSLYAHGMDVGTTHSYAFNHGREVKMVYEIRNMNRIIKKGDAVGLRFVATNSFDGKSAATFGIGILRLVCSNGMVGLEAFKGFTQKHDAKADLSKLSELITEGIGQYNKLCDRFQILTDKELKVRQRAEVARNLTLKGVFCGQVYNRVIERISQEQEIDGGDTAWGLLNSITHVHTHELSLHRQQSGERSVRKATSRLINDEGIYRDSYSIVDRHGNRYDRERVDALGEHSIFQLN
jgi:hypothetical protein